METLRLQTDSESIESSNDALSFTVLTEYKQDEGVESAMAKLEAVLQDGQKNMVPVQKKDERIKSESKVIGTLNITGPSNQEYSLNVWQSPDGDTFTIEIPIINTETGKNFLIESDSREETEGVARVLLVSRFENHSEERKQASILRLIGKLEDLLRDLENKECELMKTYGAMQLQTPNQSARSSNLQTKISLIKDDIKNIETSLSSLGFYPEQ